MFSDCAIFAYPEDRDIEALKRKFHLGDVKYGAFKSETKEPIVRFASLGAKNYSYQTKDGKEIVKCRGISLNCESTQNELDHNKMYDMVCALADPEKEHPQEIFCDSFKMHCDRQDMSIENRIVRKRYGNDGFDKRIINFDDVDNLITYPYGCKNLSFNDISYT